MLPYKERKAFGTQIIYIENGTLEVTIEPGKIDVSNHGVYAKYQYCLNGFSVNTPKEYLGQEWIIDNRWYHWSMSNAKTKFTS